MDRTSSWLVRYRRLPRDYEHNTANSEAMMCSATISDSYGFPRKHYQSTT